MSDDEKPLVGSASQERLVRYWEEKCRRNNWPSRKDINPTDLADILPFLFFLDVVWEGDIMRLRYGLTGNGGVGIAGREVTGRWFHELYPKADTAKIVARAEESIKTRQPVLYRTHMMAPGKEHINVTFLSCPLADNGKDLDGLALVLERIV